PLLPAPPEAPQGRYALIHGGMDIGSITDSMHRATIDPYRSPLHPHLFRNMGREDDPNGFYYCDGRPAAVRESYALRCKQWRHEQEMDFTCQIYDDSADAETRGSILLRIEAENLIDPFERTLPVVIRRQSHDTYAAARQVVADLGRAGVMRAIAQRSR